MPFRTPFATAGERFVENMISSPIKLIKYTVILTIYIKPSVCALGQPLGKRLPALDRAYPKIPRCRRGKRCHHGGDVCGLVVLGVDGSFRTIPTVENLWGGSFWFPPEPL